MGDDEKALDFYMQLLDEDNIVYKTRANLSIANLLEKRGNFEAAYEFLTNSINTPQQRLDSPERCDALQKRARLEEKLGKWKESLEDYRLLRDLKMRQSSTTTNCSDYHEDIARLGRKLQGEHNTHK